MYILPVSTGVQNNVNITKNNQYNQNRMSFTGEIGDKYVKKLEKGELVTNEEILDDMKGAFGFKTSIVSDVVESFVRRIKGLQRLNEQTNIALEGKTEQVNTYALLLKHKLEEENELVAKDKILKTQKTIISIQDEKIADLESRLKVFDKVGSVENLDFVSPEQTLEVLDEMLKNRHSANLSLLNYLMTGEGAEPFLKQLERQRIVSIAEGDGVLEIPKVKDKVYGLWSHGVQTQGSPISFIMGSMLRVLQGSEKGTLLNSNTIRKQVKNNAEALLAPYYSKNDENRTAMIQHDLDANLQEVINFHNRVRKGVEKVRENLRNEHQVACITVTHAPYEANPVLSGYIFDIEGVGKEKHSYYDLSKIS